MTTARHWWALTPAASGGGAALALAQVTALLQKLGVSGRHEVAEDLLRIVSTQVPMAQCTIFSFEGESAPRTVAVGDRSRTAALRRIAQDYVTRYHPLDGCRDAMRAELAAARRASAAQPHIQARVPQAGRGWPARADRAVGAGRSGGLNRPDPGRLEQPVIVPFWG